MTLFLCDHTFLCHDTYLFRAMTLFCLVRLYLFLCAVWFHFTFLCVCVTILAFVCRRSLDYQEVLDALKSKGVAIRVASPKLVMEEVCLVGLGMYSEVGYV
jgi:hypothetical protein